MEKIALYIFPFNIRSLFASLFASFIFFISYGLIIAQKNSGYECEIWLISIITADFLASVGLCHSLLHRSI